VPFIEEIPDAIRSLSASLLFSARAPASSLHPSFADAPALDGSSPAPHLTLITRANRRVTNGEALQEEARSAGFRAARVDFGSLTLQEQVTWVRQTDVLAGMYGVGLVKMVFLQPASAIVELIPYCFSNASDFWELSRALRLRHYVWRNADPALSSCDPAVKSCKVHDCGYNPPADDWRMAGGSADPLMQDTTVDLRDMALILKDAFRFVTDPASPVLPPALAMMQPDLWAPSRAGSLWLKKGPSAAGDEILGGDVHNRLTKDFRASLQNLAPFASACSVARRAASPRETERLGTTVEPRGIAAEAEDRQIECVHVV